MPRSGAESALSVTQTLTEPRLVSPCVPCRASAMTLRSRCACKTLARRAAQPRIARTLCRVALVHSCLKFADMRNALPVTMRLRLTRAALRHSACSTATHPLANEEPTMSISGIDPTSSDALQQALEAQAQTASTNLAAQQQSAFQAQLQQSQAQQPSGQNPTQHAHHHGHHHGAAGAAGSSSGAASSSSASSQPSLLSMLNAIPDDLSKVGSTAT